LDGGYKFVKMNDAGLFQWYISKDWGNDGSFSGFLISEDETNCQAYAGYYWMQVNTNPNVEIDDEPVTYIARPLFWAIIGDATPASWPDGAEGDKGQRMVYNQTTK
jgi:hypothetical protein